MGGDERLSSIAGVGDPIEVAAVINVHNPFVDEQPSYQPAAVDLAILEAQRIANNPVEQGTTKQKDTIYF